jgi:hypothetical protein
MDSLTNIHVLDLFLSIIFLTFGFLLTNNRAKRPYRIDSLEFVHYLAFITRLQ